MKHCFQFACLISLAWTVVTAADEPLAPRIDALIERAAKGEPFAAQADDAEFLRRVYLDFAGRVPRVIEARAFLADQSTGKRMQLIDRLLTAPEYAKRMADLFHVMWMERLGEHAEWKKYLIASFEKNKAWDQMAREMLRADPNAPAETRGAAFFMAKRLENYGQNPVDYPGLARDIGRLFLGKDLRCAECHDHLFIADYKQADFKGLFAFIRAASLKDIKIPAVAEKPTAGKLEFMSVFKKVPLSTGPRIPGMKEIDAPQSGVLAKLAEQVTDPANSSFARNFVNRLWYVLMGRGLVHPLDLDHSANPPSHADVLGLLTKEFTAHQFDIKWLLRELALTRVYQRSSLFPPGSAKVSPASFRVALEKRLSAEQLLASALLATETDPANVKVDALRTKFLKAFANPMREPEETHEPALRSALLWLNDETVLGWLKPQQGNLIDRLSKLPDDRIGEELYMSVLSRLPTTDENSALMSYLKGRPATRVKALGQIAWSLLASTEFGVNH